MKIKKDTTVAVDVRDRTNEERKLVRDVMHRIMGTDDYFDGRWYNDIAIITMNIPITGQTDGYGLDFPESEFNAINPITFSEFLEAVNPYNGKDVIIKIGDKEESHKAQRRLFEMGYHWSGKKKYNDMALSADLIMNDYGKLLACNPVPSDRPVVTFKQFMNLEPIPGVSKAQSKPPVDCDAYIEGTTLYVHSERGMLKLPVELAYTYNLMSKNDFMAKHGALKFGEYEVEIRDDSIKIGCVDLTKDEWGKFLDAYNKASADDVSISKVYNFLSTNKSRLGL